MENARMGTPIAVGDWVRITEELELDGVGVTVKADTVGTVQQFVDGAAWILCPTLRDQLPATSGCVVVYDLLVLERIDLGAITVRAKVGRQPCVATWKGTLAHWAKGNQDLDDLDDAVCALIRGEAVRGGGGAAPPYVVARTE